MADDLLRETHEKVRILTLNRPDDGNSLTNELTVRLAEELRAAEEDPDVAVVILTGTDPAFCHGLDRRQVTNETYDYSLLVDPARSPWKILMSMKTPVIGAINGAAVTGGFGIALMCGFLVASERATFGENYARILQTHPMAGLVTLLAQAVGVRRARELSFTGDHMGAAEAHERHLVNHVVPHAELLPVTRELAMRIAANDQKTVGLLNDLYRKATFTTFTESLAGEEKGYREREMDLKNVLARYRDRIWSEPIKTTRS
jgi:enoyl-CoA hydratase